VWFLTVSYEIYRTIRKPENINLHLQAVTERLTTLLYKDLGRQPHSRQLKVEQDLNIPLTTSNSINNRANLPMLSLRENFAMAHLRNQETEIRNWLLNKMPK